MDFIDKKEKFADMIEEYIDNPSTKEVMLLAYIDELSRDDDFKGKVLFINIFNELKKYLPELSRKELKQRVLMIRSYLE